MILKKYFYFVLLILASVFVMPSCSEDNDGLMDGENPSEEQEGTYSAGDDFYWYANGEWHNSLTNTDVTQGFLQETADLMEQKINEVAQTMDEVNTINLSITHLYNGGQQANLDRVEELVEELLADVNTKNDAYRAIGKMIGMGLTEGLAEVCMVYDGDAIHYTISPVSNEEEGEAEAKFGRRALKKIDWKKFKKYTPKSRTAEDAVLCMVEGLGLDPDYMMFDEDLTAFVENLENCTLDELKEFIQDNVASALLPYCGDEYVQQITEGSLESTMDYYNAMFKENFSYSLAYHYYQAYVSAEVKEKFKAYGEEFKGVFAKRIENNAWLTEQSKQLALEKLENMKLFFGWPDDEYTEEGFAKPKGELLVDDMLEVKMSRTRLIEAKLGKNPREESMMFLMYSPGEHISLAEYNSVNLPFLNTVNIFSTFMIEPEFSLDMDLSETYVSLSTLGHEMAHSFDPEGIQYGPDGSESAWMATADKATFDAIIAQFAEQISSLEALPGISQDGNVTVGENMSDLVGLNIAFDALNECLKKNGVTGDLLTESQQAFFECYASRYRTNYSAEDIQTSLQDSHGINTIRVNGIVQHMDNWYDLYNVTTEALLYLPKEERIAIW